MDKLVLIDGNSIMNRAFYGIGGRAIMTSNGLYTNAIYGFLAIMFRLIEDTNPKYLVVSFDLKAPTARHKMYEGYKANRKGMPDELAQQMPIIKDILRAMNIDIVEKEGYEADDVLGTLSKYGEEQGLDVIILSGDRDTFQLATNKVTIRIPRTKGGKTETDNFDRNKVLEVYGIEPMQLKDVKGLQGDSSDNIPGVPGVGEKTALSLIQRYGSIENLYEKIEKGEDDLKGKQREKIIENKDLAFLSKTLGTINLEVPIDHTLEDFKVEEWNKKEVLEFFQKLNFKRYIERFDLKSEDVSEKKKKLAGQLSFSDLEISKPKEEIPEISAKELKSVNEFTFVLDTKKVENNELIIKEEIVGIKVFLDREYYCKTLEDWKDIFENPKIKKTGRNLTREYILLKQNNITLEGMAYDVLIASYILNPTEKHDSMENASAKEVHELQKSTFKELEEVGAVKLFNEIDMPTVEVLSDMQWNGMYVDQAELETFGVELTQKIETVKNIIYEMAGEEFNINSTKQLGEILFEKMNLPVIKKTKSGYSTDVEVLEKLKKEDPIIEQILEYRQLMKLNSTYIEGLKQYINPKTHRIHSFFHQTITATGRISSTDPNLQNIPTRFELGKRVRKVFKSAEGKVFLDADYSQIELRVLADVSGDEHMIEAFKEGQDIHKQAASKVFKTPIEEVSKEQRSSAKAVNFGIVYGISEFGLANQLGITRKLAKQYIDEYLEEYKGIKKFMDNIIEEAKQRGYVSTKWGRRRYIPELKAKNYMVRQFGQRAAMNTPIQGTAADIMKIAMINVYRKLKEKGLKSKIVLQVHDEMIIEAPKNEVEEVKTIMKTEMENATSLKVPLIAELSEAENWYDCK